jgi:hypothetical protein
MRWENKEATRCACSVTPANVKCEAFFYSTLFKSEMKERGGDNALGLTVKHCSKL